MSTKSKIQLGLKEGEKKKPVRTISGVTPLTVVLGPRKCDHGTCIYCPGGDYVPQSYTDKSPAIMRAMKLNYDPYQQVKNRLKVLNLMNHPTDKIEIIILGGTFLQYPKEYKYNFIKRIFEALNDGDSETLEDAKMINESKSKISSHLSIEELKNQLKKAQLKNETAEHRCVAMCIENRPDNCSDEDIKEMLDFGATRVEIGVQMPDNELYKKTNRGHSVQDVVDATINLKNAGFKVGYHIMPGLPYSNKKKDLELFKQLFSDERFRPDQLKIYPCQVVEDSPLAKTHKLIGFKPYTQEETKEILSRMMLVIPDYCRVMRMMREFPKEKLIDGLKRLDLRKEIEEEFRNKGLKIHEIRMREVGFNKDNLDFDVKIKIVEYNASNGKEFFLEFVNKDDILFGLLRLRICDVGAIIRELHVYGQALNLGDEGKESQHLGLGKMLMKKAEEIVKENGFEKLSVISGVGVREYYRKLGYKLEGDYMIKKI